MENFIKNKYMPPRVGLFQFLYMYVSLKYLDAPGWVWGVIFTFMGIHSIYEACRLFYANAKDVTLED